MSLHGCQHLLAEVFASYLESGYRAKLVEYPTFDLRLLKRCHQRTAASVFGSLNPFPKTQFVINRLKGAETLDWMASRPAFRKATFTNDLSMPGLVDVVANIVVVWPLVVPYLKKTGRTDDGDSLVVRPSTVGVFSTSCNCAHYFFAVLEEENEQVSILRSACSFEVQVVPSSSRNLSVSSSHPQYDLCWYVVVPDQLLKNSRNALVPFHDGSTLYYWVDFCIIAKRE